MLASYACFGLLLAVCGAPPLHLQEACLLSNRVGCAGSENFDV